MYVQWLLEFVWRIFIQGPLMVISFFTSNNQDGNNLNNLLQNVGFINKENNSYAQVINLSLVVSIFIAIAALFVIIVFLYKLFKMLIISRDESTKIQLIETIKEFTKTILFSFVFTIFFGTIFILFDLFFKTINEAGNNLISNNDLGIDSIPSVIYELITNVAYNPKDNPNFLFPTDNFLEISNGMNYAIVILFVITFVGFLIWIIWSIFQKMIEIIFLYITFPISLAIGQESQKINWKIWTKEIFNKIGLIFIFAILLRAFLYLFISIHANIVTSIFVNNKNNYQLYLDFFIVLALGGSMIFISKMFSVNAKENVGIFGSFSSFKQTRDFINTNKNEVLLNLENISFEPINANIDYLRNEIMQTNKLIINYQDLKKVRVFNK